MQILESSDTLCGLIPGPVPCHRAPARPTSSGGQRPRACHPLPRSSGGSAAPLERAREEQEQEAGQLRLTSARVARAHAKAVGRAGEHLFCKHRLLVPFARDLRVSLCWRELTWPDDGEYDDARDGE